MSSVLPVVKRGIAWSSASMLIGKVIIFVNVFFILQHLSVYSYGLTQLVLSVTATLGIFQLPGLSSAVLADMGIERSRGEFGTMKSMFLQFFGLSMLLSLIAWASLFFGSNIAAHLAGNDTIGYLMKIASFTLLLSPLRSASTLLASVELRFLDQSFYGVIEEVAKLGCIGIFFFWFGMGAEGLLLATAISQLMAVVVFLPRSISAYRVFGHAKAEHRETFWHTLSAHRKWSVASNYVGQLGNTIQLWLIKFFLGTEAVGLFSFAEGVLGQVIAVLPLGAILTPLLPRYVNQPKDFARYVRSAVKAQALIAVPLIIATYIGIPILVVLFPKYMPAVPMFLILTPSIFTSAVGSVYTPGFVSLRQQLAFFWTSIWKVFFFVTIFPLCIIFFGVPGVGLGFLLASLASTIERTLRLKRVMPEFYGTLRDFLEFDPMEKMLLQNAWRQMLKGRLGGLFNS